MIDKALLTAEEAAAYLTISRTYVYDLKGSGKLRHVKIGRCLRFRKIDLDAFIEAQLATGVVGFNGFN
jgi:excisionase family DNA binding protein